MLKPYEDLTVIGLEYDEKDIREVTKQLFKEHGFIPNPWDIVIGNALKFHRCIKGHMSAREYILKSLEIYRNKENIPLNELLDILFTAWPNSDDRNARKAM